MGAGTSKHDPLDVGLPNDVRREQTERELARVESEIKSWFDLRNARDKDVLDQYAGLHRTRLDTLQGVLQCGLRALNEALGKVDVSAGRDSQQVYAECRSIDKAVVWVQRVWLYYKDKLDQRDDTTLTPVLQAADEVIWSCYSQVFANKNNLPDGVVQGPAPLAYIDAQYSPATWEATKRSPSELRESNDIPGLEEFLQTLPVPILRLPPWCVGAPWWLVTVAHEVGHNIQRELDLVNRFGSLLEAVCLEQKPPITCNPTRWKEWGPEIFADLFSVAIMGPWAVRSLREILLGPVAEMNKPQGGYPAPVVRLALVAQAGDRLGLAGSGALGGLDLDKLSQDSPLAQADLQMVKPILGKALGPLSDRVSALEKLCGLEEAREDLDKRVPYWSQSLHKTPPTPTRSLRAPRYITCGAWVAWEQASQLRSPAERRDALDALATNAVDVLRKSGPLGTRAKRPEPTNLEQYGADLAHRLLEASRQTPVQD